MQANPYIINFVIILLIHFIVLAIRHETIDLVVFSNELGNPHDHHLGGVEAKRPTDKHDQLDQLIGEVLFYYPHFIVWC